MKKFFSAAALVALAAAPALAQSELDGTLASLSAARGDDYVAKRDAAVKNLKTADLQAKLETATWTDATFNDLAMATIVLAFQKDGDAVKKVYALDGLNEAVYTQWRIRRPDATRELNALAGRAVGPLLELYLKTFDKYPGYSKTEAVAKAEKVALSIGIVVALGKVRHPAAIFVAKRMANDANEPEGVRNQAIGALGVIDTAASVAEIQAVHDAAATPAELKLATLRGAAWSSQQTAFDLIAKDLESSDLGTRKQAAVALGTFCSPMGWQSRNDVVTGQNYRTQAAQKLVDALVADKLPRDTIVDQIGVIGHPSAKPLLQAAETNTALTAEQRETAKQALGRLEINIERNGGK
ncbi:MAG: hypothetical protein ACAI25_15595 [Planctomycetota bacterium]